MAGDFFLREDLRVLTPEAFDFVLNNELKRAVRSQSFLTLLVVELVGTGFTGSLKFKGRAAGRGSAGAAAGAAGYTENLSIRNRLSDATIAGGTGITATGIYEIDITGLEVLPVLTVGAGSVAVYGSVNGG